MALQICDLKMVEKCRRPSVSVVGCFHPGACHWMLDYIAWTFYLLRNVQRQFETRYIALRSPTQVIRSDPSPLLWAPQTTATYPHFLAWQKKHGLCTVKHQISRWRVTVSPTWALKLACTVGVNPML